MLDLLKFSSVIVAAAAVSLVMSFCFNLGDMWGVVIMAGILINTALLTEVVEWFRWNRIKVVKHDPY